MSKDAEFSGEIVAAILSALIIYSLVKADIWHENTPKDKLSVRCVVKEVSFYNTEDCEKFINQK